jgi:dipeptidyl aminopeptidase/acylaminoacyl peptidase
VPWRITLGIAGLVGVVLAIQSAEAAQNGPKIAFGSTKGGWAVHTVGVDGLGDQRLTGDPPTAFEGEARWSPDGTRLAYVCGNFEICVMNADGSGRAKLTSTPTSWPTAFNYEFDPAWSPDGTRIAFASNQGLKRFDIFVATADGSSVARLGGTGSDDVEPTWSPDGMTLVFASEATGNGDLYLINADGTGLRRLTSTSAIEGDPDWALDGTVVFELYDGDQTDLAVMRSDGTGRRSLTKTSYNEDDPAWSPDGTKLAFSSDSSGNWDVFVREPGGRRRLTDGLAAEIEPSWQPAPPSGAAHGTERSTAPPTPPSEDARVVGELLRWDIQLLGELTGVGSDSLSAAMTNATAFRKDAGRAKRTLTARRPVTPRGQRVRRLSIKAFATAQELGRSLETAVAMLRRGNRKVAFFYALVADLQQSVWDDEAWTAYSATRLP